MSISTHPPSRPPRPLPGGSLPSRQVPIRTPRARTAADRYRYRRHTILTTAVAASLVLAACGGSSDAGHDADHGGDTIDSAGRLALFASDAAAIHVHDLDQGAIREATHPVDAPVTAIYTSPQQRYAVAFQGNANQVQFIDGGLWREDHGDHLHDYRQASRAVAWRLTGPTPSHFNVQSGRQAAIFMDGIAEPLQVARAFLINDAAIGSGQALAQLSLDQSIHGLAVPINDQLLTVSRAADATAAGPTHLQRFQRQGSGYAASTVLPTRCDRMHGAYDDGTSLVVGCNDGVVLVRHTGDNSVDDGVAIATPIRISTIAGHPQAAGHFIGFGADGVAPALVTTRFFAVDANAGTAAELLPQGWGSGRVRRAHGFDRSGERFFVLDDLGTLYVLQRSGAAWSTQARIAGAIPVMPTAAPWPALASSGARDTLYLSDPVARQLLTLDAATGASQAAVALDYTPGGLTWLGIAR